MNQTLFGSPFAHVDQPIIISKTLVSQLIVVAQKQLPYEFTALLGGHKNIITSFYPATSEVASTDTFLLSPSTFFQIMNQIKEQQESWLGVLHTHPLSPAVPSSLDIHGWHYPDLCYWILSFASKKPDLALYQIRQGHAQKHSYQIS
ncbi:M67 family peptidase [Brevibacillus laterosporus]|nr:M67 family metallopeptidase [Brevibacillus laterosporus]TPG69711.1 M67 family peptidase [Brevibacillus laterosporus]